MTVIYFLGNSLLTDSINTDFNSMMKSTSLRNIAVDDEKSISKDKPIVNYDLVKLIDNDQNTILEKLLKEGKVDPDVVNYHGLRTALLHAASELKTQSFLILAKYGADINYQDSHGGKLGDRCFPNKPA
ncbi:hypothetical protein ACFODZ_14955 [Marinicella sediminis]|uniref:Ankyrin repeat domain-containing protein n=1 Tax=Marinicella sediminis TaxID=1792834 RepID=A0ABV7JJM4_9GAMM